MIIRVQIRPMTLLDRETERRQLEEVLRTPRVPSVTVVCLHGPLGAGKTELLKHAAIIAAQNRTAFRTADGRTYMRFGQPDSGTPFAALEPIVGALAIRRPKLFAAVTADTSPSLPVLPVRQLAISAAGISKFTNTFGAAYAAESRSFRDARTQMLGLVNETRIAHALSDFIARAVREDHACEQVVFVLDDIHLVDVKSLRVLLSSLRTLCREGRSSLLICAADGPSLGPSASIQQLVSEYTDVQSIDLPIEQLDRETTYSIIKTLMPRLSVDDPDFLFHATSGNFADIVRLQRTNSDSVRVLYENWKLEHSSLSSSIASTEFWRDHIDALLTCYPSLRVCFEVLLATGNTVTIGELAGIVCLLCKDGQVGRSATAALVARIAPAVETGDIQVVGEHVIADRRALTAARSLLVEDGSLARRMALIGTTLASEELDAYSHRHSRTTRVIRILTEYAPTRAIEVVDAVLSDVVAGRATIDDALLNACVSASLTVPLSETAGAEVERLASLVQYARQISAFEEGVRAGAVAVPRRAWLERPIQYESLSAYLSCLREAGALVGDDGTSVGRIVIEELLDMADTSEEQIHALLLAASVYEHLNDYGAIQAAFHTIDGILARCERVSPLLRSAYARNLGLAIFHGDAIEACAEALRELDERSDDPAVVANRAGLLNHIGLGHYHTGRIAIAMDFFAKSGACLETLGRRMETVWNNQGACLLHCGNMREAMTFFQRAREYPIKPRYQSISIDINYAVCLELLGNSQLAVKILRAISDGAVVAPDPALVSHARANLGFCMMRAGDHVGAARYYALSNEHTFRFLAKECARLRNLLARYNAARAGILAGEDLGDISYVDLALTGDLPVRRPYQLDLNSLYVI